MNSLSTKTCNLTGLFIGLVLYLRVPSVLNSHSLSFYQIWPCSWTRGSLSTTVPVGKKSSSLQPPSHFCSSHSLPFPPLSEPHQLKCHIPLVVASGDRSYHFPPRANGCFGRSKQAHLHLPLSLSAVISLFLSPSLSTLILSLRVEILLLMLEISYVGRSGLLQTPIITNLTQLDS